LFTLDVGNSCDRRPRELHPTNTALGQIRTHSHRNDLLMVTVMVQVVMAAVVVVVVVIAVVVVVVTVTILRPRLRTLLIKWSEQPPVLMKRSER